MGLVDGIQEYVGSARRCRRELRNWPSVLIRLGAAHLGWDRGAFTVSSRTGVTLTAPNHRLSRWPPIEILVDDSYRIRGQTWDNPLAPRCVLDIGAHVGSFTCALAARLPGATFTCVEPLPSTLAWLAKNLALNGIRDRTTIIPAAVARADGEAELWASNDGSTEASLDADLWASWHPSSVVPETSKAGRRVTVRTMRFESLVAAAGGRADVVKLDCEGGEYPAVLEASPTAWATVQRLFIEYHPIAGHHFREISDRLTELGLLLVWQRPSSRPGMGIAHFAR